VLRTLFDNLLDLSRFDAGEIRPVLRAVSLRDLLAPCVLEQEVIAHAKGLKFHSQIAPGWVHTDPELVRRVVGNLLSNATTYTPRGSVSIVAAAEAGQVRIVIIDTGIGIAADDQARVFDEFVQLSNPARERDKGVGLGLSIVRRIAGLLALDLRLESEPGRGTAVTFTIPHSAGDHVEVAESELSFASAGAFRGARVWIVEDDRLVRDALFLQFKAWEASPAFATSTAELLALRETDGRWPDAVVLDDMLASGEQGLEIARMLRGHLDENRIVLVTGNVDPVRTLQLEASGLVVLRKPLSSSDLAQWLRHAMRAGGGVTTSPAHEPAG
jgi:CheY-like chemotaxis protein/anti-sigma regulatory factor (Ser/Thr protein kinase)